jgi:hypothetical protein
VLGKDGDSLMNTYSAKLLFQFRVTIDGDPGKRRTCEERIILVKAGSAQLALKKAKREGIKGQCRYKNADGNPVFFEFIGIMDLLHLGVECGNGEVWYDMKERLLPSERKDKLIPPESMLSAILHESNPGKQQRWPPATY